MGLWLEGLALWALEPMASTLGPMGSCIQALGPWAHGLKAGVHHQKLENGKIGTLEASPQLRTTSERSSGLLYVAWKAWQAALEAERPE